MSDLITVQGMVISAMPVGEYDKRVVLLTRERGKISAFAKGARKQNSPMMAAANPFVFGSFTLYEGRSSYNLTQVSITHHFAELALVQPGIYYGYYFLELADYFGREGNDEFEVMNLLYVTVKALMSKKLKEKLIRCIFELRIMAIQGLMPQLFQCVICGKEIEENEHVFFSQNEHGILDEKCAANTMGVKKISAASLYTMRYIVSSNLTKLYSFTVTDSVLSELEGIINTYVDKNTDKRFKSLEILNVMI